MDEANPLQAWLRRGALAVGLFLAGALLAFGYSYRPLHGALSWKVEALEERLDERNRENLRLGDELARLRSLEADRIDPEQLGAVEAELAQTRRALAQAEKDLKRAERKRKDANASASRWRKRYETLRDETARVVTPAAPAPAATPETPTPSRPGPTTPAPGFAPSATGPDPGPNRGAGPAATPGTPGAAAAGPRRAAADPVASPNAAAASPAGPGSGMLPSGGSPGAAPPEADPTATP